jgi:hypothetical protein
LLSQWRGYSDNGSGFSLGFSTSHGVLKLIGNTPHPIDPNKSALTEVTYGVDNTDIESFIEQIKAGKISDTNPYSTTMYEKKNSLVRKICG